MSRVSPALAHPPAGIAVEIADGMSVPAGAGTVPATWLVDLSPLRRWLVRGGQAALWLAAKGLPLPEEYFRVHPLHGDAFLVRTGAAEYFLHDGPDARLATRLGEIPGGLLGGMRVAARDDLEVMLGGAHAAHIMTELCALELRAVEKQFLFTRVAGVGVWLCVEGGPQAPCFRIGCDPSYGAYLFETLHALVHEQGGGVIGFHDYFQAPTGEQA